MGWFRRWRTRCILKKIKDLSYHENSSRSHARNMFNTYQTEYERIGRVSLAEAEYLAERIAKLREVLRRQGGKKMTSAERNEYMEYMIEELTGISATTILLNAQPSLPRPSSHQHNRPYDLDDLGRCHKLLTMFPELYASLDSLIERFPEWESWVTQLIQMADEARE